MSHLAIAVALSLVAGAVEAQAAGEPGREEFGLTSRDLVEKVDRVEALLGESSSTTFAVALREYSAEMREKAFDYGHPDEVEADVQGRHDELTGGGSIPLEKLSPDSRTALGKLQDYERRVAVVDFELEEGLIEDVDERIERDVRSKFRLSPAS